MKIFDSSSIYACVKSGNHGLLKGNCSVILARYELGNVIWKETMLRKTFSIAEAGHLIAFIDKIMETMVLLHPPIEEVFSTAVNFGLSYYDASYVYCAQNTNGVLITEDAKLRKKITPQLKTGSFAEISERL
jgi:predicted nucleic acid-binding protein